MGQTLQAVVGHIHTDIEPEMATSHNLKQTEAWKVSVEMRNEPEWQTNTWDVNAAPPSDDEVMNAAKATRHNRVIAGVIPTELWTNSPLATRILSMLVQCVWSGENPLIS